MTEPIFSKIELCYYLLLGTYKNFINPVSMKKKSNSSEQASHQSAAEFFSEHQQIAGFDNVGFYFKLILCVYELCSRPSLFLRR